MASQRAATTLGSALARPTVALRAGAALARRQNAAALCLSSKAAAVPSSSARRPFLPAGSTASITLVQPRWYSAGASVPGSKRWDFADIKKELEGSGSGDKKSDIIFVDVREPAELFETGKIPGAINIPITSAVQSFHISDADFEDMYGFERPGKDKTLVFYCKAGVRARSAAGLAQHAGWESIGEYPGSWLDWEVQQGPVEKVRKGGN